MAKKQPKVARNKQPKGRLAHEAEGGVGGAIAGAALGSVAGPPGMVAGAVMGAAVGALTAAIMDEEGAVISKHDHELDDAIGVSGGEMGAPNLKHPPERGRE